MPDPSMDRAHIRVTVQTGRKDRRRGASIRRQRPGICCIVAKCISLSWCTRASRSRNAMWQTWRCESSFIRFEPVTNCHWQLSLYMPNAMSWFFSATCLHVRIERCSWYSCFGYRASFATRQIKILFRELDECQISG